MRKVLTMIVVLFMVLSLSGIALAEEITVTSTGTQDVLVSYASTVPAADFTVTIPASLTTGDEGTVKAAGKWGESQVLSVTTDSTVTLYLGGEETADYATVPVEYVPLSLSGNYNGNDVSGSSTITVDPAESLSQVMKFGTWKGKLVFTISMAGDGGQARDVMSYVNQDGLNAAIAAGITEFTISGGDEWNTGWNAIPFTAPESTLTITGGTFTGMLMTGGNGYVTIKITDGTFNGYLWIENTKSLTITGGTFDENVVISIEEHGFEFIISGGTFKLDPRDQFSGLLVKIAEGHTVQENDDGTWTVVPASSTV